MVRWSSMFAVAGLALLGCRSVPATVETEPEPPPVVVEAEEPGPLFGDLFVDEDYGCALARDGRVWCWGNDPAAALDLRRDGARWEQATTISELEGVVAIDGDFFTTCAVLEDGQVRCWQRPSRGRSDGYAPEFLPGVADAVDVEVAGEVCVRTRSGEIHCSTLRGEHRRQVASDAIDFEFGGRRSCALDSGGGIWCWDSFADYIRNSPVPWAGTVEVGDHGEVLLARLPGAVEIGVGDTNGDVVVRMASGEILIEPQVGPELALPVSEYMPIPGATDAVALAFGEGHGCVVAEPGDGAREVRCFRANGWAQLGAGDSRAHAEAVRVAGLGSGPGDEVFGVAASRSLSCASMKAGVSCWGTRLPAAEDSVIGVPYVVATEVASMALESSSTCVTTTDGRNLCWGSTGLPDFEADAAGIFAASQPRPLALGLGRLRAAIGYCFLDDAGLLLCGRPAAATFGASPKVVIRTENVSDYAWAETPCFIRAGALRCGEDDEPESPLPKLRRPTAIAASGDTLCAIHDGGTVACFRVPEVVEGEDPPPIPARIDVPDTADTVQLLGSERSPSHCYSALQGSGIVRIFCVPDGAKDLELLDVGTLALEPVTKIIRTQIGICGLTGAGIISCESYGDRTISNFEIPDTVDIAGQGNHFCALADDGTLTCIGDNHWGQLGTVPATVIAAPRAIEFE